MYKFVFVDDEILALEHLKTLMDYAKYSCELVNTFLSAEELLEYLETNTVDLIVTDVSMCGMSGIELAEICTEKYPHIAVAFISAHRDFETARSAITNNVIEFITKPILLNELDRAFSNMKKVLDKQQVKKEDYDDTSQIAKNLVINYINGDITYEYFIGEWPYTLFDFNENSTKYVIYKIDIQDYEKYMDSKWKYGTERFRMAVSRAVNHDDEGVYSLALKHEYASFKLMIIYNDAEECRQHMNIIKDDLRTLIGINVECQLFQAERLFYDGKMKVELEATIDNSIENALEYINAHYLDDLSLNRVAESVALNPVYFSRCFKKQTGIRFIDYLVKLRIEKAKELLKNDIDLKIYNVCEMVGYKSVPHFYKVFKDYTGITPVEFRDNLNKDKGE